MKKRKNLKFRLVIDLGADGDLTPTTGLAYMLKETSIKMANMNGVRVSGLDGQVRDINGEVVGTYKVS